LPRETNTHFSQVRVTNDNGNGFSKKTLDKIPAHAKRQPFLHHRRNASLTLGAPETKSLRLFSMPAKHSSGQSRPHENFIQLPGCLRRQLFASPTAEALLKAKLAGSGISIVQLQLA